MTMTCTAPFRMTMCCFLRMLTLCACLSLVTSFGTTFSSSSRPFLVPTVGSARTKTTTALFGKPSSSSDNSKQSKQWQREEGVKHSTPSSSHSPLITPSFRRTVQSAAVGLALGLATLSVPSLPALATSAEQSTQIVTCLFSKCTVALGKCILNPKCLANVACINTCNGKEDEIGCQIECGNLFENEVVGEFNKCAVTDMTCVPKKYDDGSYPVPTADQVVPKFDTSLFNGRWYITAGQNKLFDTFPCQVHFFTETAPGKFFGKLNWRIEEPDGEYFTRDALQEFVQDSNMPAHLVNDGNEYLHYSDEWWILDYAPDNNPEGIPPFALVYYRGDNDAWEGYGGAVVYTREAALPESLRPRLRTAAAKVHFDFDRDFEVTDNSCPAELSLGEKAVLREKFAGKVALQTEEQLQAAAVRLRGNVVNSSKAQRLFFENRLEDVEKAFGILEGSQADFEQEQKQKQQQPQ